MGAVSSHEIYYNHSIASSFHAAQKTISNLGALQQNSQGFVRTTGAPLSSDERFNLMVDCVDNYVNMALDEKVFVDAEKISSLAAKHCVHRHTITEKILPKMNQAVDILLDSLAQGLFPELAESIFGMEEQGATFLDQFIYLVCFSISFALILCSMSDKHAGSKLALDWKGQHILYKFIRLCPHVNAHHMREQLRANGYHVSLATVSNYVKRDLHCSKKKTEEMDANCWREDVLLGRFKWHAATVYQLTKYNPEQREDVARYYRQQYLADPSVENFKRYNGLQFGSNTF